MWKFVANKCAKLNASGFVTEGPGMGGGAIEGGLGAIMMGSLIGAFIGLICGLLVSHLFRFLSMSFNRNLGGYSWVIYCTILGAAVFALITINTEKH